MILGSRSQTEVTPLAAPPYTVHPEDAREARRFAAVLTEDGRPADTAFRVLQEDGASVHVRMAGVPVSDGPEHPGRVFGTVQDVSHLRRTETALEIARVQLAAQRTRVDVERQVATLLQQIVLPNLPVRPADEFGIEVAARYRPASTTAGVGGDWYGVFPLPGERTLLTIGDVAGHGLAAASAMAQLYHTAHGLALTGAGPAALLHWLNALTCERQEFTIASSCCALYEPAEHRLTWANAGHPSPVLVPAAAGRAATLEAPIGTMLGAASVSVYEEAVVTIEPGDHLLLYTDGLVERRRQSDEESTAHLLAMAEQPDGDLDAYANRLVAGAHSDTDDDVCLIAVRFR
jgi:serine phosphatase RsbU (regulator of sigma subunit)